MARTHERARWKREDFAHQHSRRVVNAFDLIAVEDLALKQMVQNARLAKSIHDVAWGEFVALIAWKAVCATRRFIAVNPAHTSQDCSGCGLVIDRDLNAALNILALGRQCLASA